MRLSSLITIAVTFLIAAILSLITANYSVQLIEERSEIGVRNTLDDRGLEWAEVTADGLQVTLSGIAPDEAVRFQALTAAGSVVDAARVIDNMEVEALAAIAPPRFSVEILRNDAGISVIGLVPAAQDRDALTDQFAQLAGRQEFTDLLESADYPTPPAWEDAMSFALSALDDLLRAKVSVEAGRVRITAMAESEDAKARLERSLRRSAPPAVNVSLSITAPRPVLTPFTLRFVQDEDGVRFDACSADSDAARARIINAATRAGMTNAPACTIGMGVPTPRWAEAAEKAIAAVSTIGGGSVTFSDADVALLAPEGTDQGLFDRVVGELENALPGVFALKAVLPRTDDPDAGPPEFTATLSPEGQVQLRGRMSSQATRGLATSYAQSLFGSRSVHTAARLDEGLPPGWSKRVLTGLEALGNLSNGVVVVTPDTLSVSGNTGDDQANSRIAQLLADKLGEAEIFDINVTYREKLDPVASLPTPEECETRIGEITTSRKINFEPGSAKVDTAAVGILDDIATILAECGELRLEVQGHTDSQGGEDMNLSLSQQRSQSVLNELRSRGVLTTGFRAKGYGESKPVANNETEEGREANRRIEFRLIKSVIEAADSTTLDSMADDAENAPAEQENASE